MGIRAEQHDIVGELIIGHGKDKKPYASWRCRCGARQKATGPSGVSKLMTRYRRHEQCRKKPMEAWVYDLGENVLRAD